MRNKCKNCLKLINKVEQQSSTFCETIIQTKLSYHHFVVLPRRSSHSVFYGGFWCRVQKNPSFKRKVGYPCGLVGVVIFSKSHSLTAVDIQNYSTGVTQLNSRSLR
jgi:hypothetical protein